MFCRTVCLLEAFLLQSRPLRLGLIRSKSPYKRTLCDLPQLLSCSTWFCQPTGINRSLRTIWFGGNFSVSPAGVRGDIFQAGMCERRNIAGITNSTTKRQQKNEHALTQTHTKKKTAPCITCALLSEPSACPVRLMCISVRVLVRG